MRQTTYACASFALVFDEVYEFEAGETITQRYQLVIANGDWDATRVEAVAGAWRGITGAELRCASARRGAARSRLSPVPQCLDQAPTISTVSTLRYTKGLRVATTSAGAAANLALGSLALPLGLRRTC